MSFFSQKRSWFSLFKRSLHRKPRPIRLTLEALEDRMVLSTLFAPEAQFSQILTAMNPNSSASPLDSAAYTPAQIRQAYGFNQITFDNGAIQGNGAGQTIAIIEPSADPNIVSDASQFNAAYNLPQFNAPGGPALQVESLTINGQTPEVDPSGSCELETALDVEWAHVIAPEANIMLVDAPVQLNSDGSWNDPTITYEAAQWAANQNGVSVVSMSFGGSSAGESANDSYFTTPPGHAGVTFVAAAGDHGEFEYPASSPNVLAVGGTTLTVDSSGDYLGETVWNEDNGWDSGGGPDPNYPVKQGPDVAYNAGAPVLVYDSFDNSQNPWLSVIGTSAGAPQWAALIAIADQGRALEGLGTLDGPSQTLPMLHNLPSTDFHTDIPGSNQNGVTGQEVIGLGTPYANLVVAGLAQEAMPSPPPAPSPPPVFSPPPFTFPPVPTPSPVNSPPPLPSPPPAPSPPVVSPKSAPSISVSAPQPLSAVQLFLDGITLAIDLSGADGFSAALANESFMHDIDAAPGGLFNPYLDAGFSAALSALHGSHNG